MKVNVDRNPFSKIWPLLLFLLVLPGISYFVRYGLPTTHDGLIHLWRLSRLDAYIRDGMLYPRWMPEMNLGYGYPTFNYYASATYYVAEILKVLGLNLSQAFMGAQWLFMYFGAVSMYLLARDIYGRKDVLPPLVAAVVYAYSPYLIINMYVRGAIAELGAQMLWPLILWSFRRVWYSENPRTYVLVAAFSLGGLALTHTISLLIVPPVLAVYLLVLARGSNSRYSRSGWSVLAIAAAMAISSFYWLPLLLERDFISHIGLAISKEIMLPENFYNISDLIDFNLSYQYPLLPVWPLGAVQVICVLIAVPFAIKKSGEWWFWVGILLFCLLMMISPASPIWYSNNILPIIQFPWRLLAVIQLPIALMCGLLITFVNNRLIRGAISLTLIGIIIWALATHSIATLPFAGR